VEKIPLYESGRLGKGGDESFLYVMLFDLYTSPPVSPSPGEALRRRGGGFNNTILPLVPPPLGKEGEVYILRKISSAQVLTKILRHFIMDYSIYVYL
jgi:hypothetical protein